MSLLKWEISVCDLALRLCISSRKLLKSTLTLNKALRKISVVNNFHEYNIICFVLSLEHVDLYTCCLWEQLQEEDR
jgi:hypothetical protein